MPKKMKTLPTYYEIRVEGNLPPEWQGWFDDLTIAPQANGETLICGLVTDQAALYGLLKKVRDLGLALLSVNALSDHSQKEEN